MLLIAENIIQIIFLILSSPEGARMLARGGQIDPNIDSIDTNVGIGIGSILAW